jgi:hypothetical protein
MPDAPECQAGHQPVNGRPFIVKIGEDEKVPMCEPHGRTFQFGNALIANLGRDHPIVVNVIAALNELMHGGCPEREGVPLPGPIAGENPDSLLRRESGPPCAGSHNGLAKS